MNKEREMMPISEQPAPSSRPRSAPFWWHRDHVRLLRLALVVPVLAAGLAYLVWHTGTPTVTGTASCDLLPARFQTSQSVAPSSIHTIQQAYNCMLDKYPAQPSLDDRPLLNQAMAGMLAYLLEQNADQHLTALPRLSGNRASDWQAFARTYAATIAHLPSFNEEALVHAIIKAMVDGLHDDHANFVRDAAQASTTTTSGLRAQVQDEIDFGLGMRFAFYPTQLTYASAPLIVREVTAGSPAAQAGIRPGDTIATVNNLPPFLGKALLQPVLALLSGKEPVKVQIQRPGSTSLLTLTLTPTAFPTPPLVSSHLLPGNILYVRLTRFETRATQQISALVQQAGGTSLRGLILDLRGNGGGEVAEQQRLLGLFVHDRVLATFVDGQGQSSEQKPDTHVALLHLPLVALIDHECASACENTAVDIRDLHLGRLVGERTAGLVSGPSTSYFLDDGSVLILPAAFIYGPAGEIVDGIGVPPDDEVQPTPTQLASGQDPVLAKALQNFS